MITLKRITETARLEEYYRFRHRIYSESRQAGFVNGNSNGLDMDAFDARALHFGWYLNEALIGCVRFVEPGQDEDALPMLSYMTEGAPRNAVKGFVAERRKRGERMVEASRFCLAPEHRGLRTAKEFVLTMSKTLHEMGIDLALFDCHLRHAQFYRRLGFEILDGAAGFTMPGYTWRGCTMSFNYKVIRAASRVINEIPQLFLQPAA